MFCNSGIYFSPGLTLPAITNNHQFTIVLWQVGGLCNHSPGVAERLYYCFGINMPPIPALRKYAALLLCYVQSFPLKGNVYVIYSYHIAVSCILDNSLIYDLR